MTSQIVYAAKPTIIRMPTAPCKMTPIWRRLSIGFGEFPFTDVASKWAWSLGIVNCFRSVIVHLSLRKVAKIEVPYCQFGKRYEKRQYPVSKWSPGQSPGGNLAIYDVL